MKAIAVSVSNAIDRAEMDRLVIKKINESIADLEIRSKQHYYRLNDHILKVIYFNKFIFKPLESNVYRIFTNILVHYP